jgi:hypothetical protein
LDLVVHLDRDLIRDADAPLRRRVIEVLAVVPSLYDDFSTEPLFQRSHLDAALEWTGAVPPDDLAEQLQRALPADVALRDVLEGRVALL